MEREEQQKTKLAAIQDRLEIEENLSRQRNYKTLQKIEQLSTGLNRRILLLEEYNEDHKEQNWEVFFRYLTYVLLLCSNIFTILYNQYPDSKTLAWTASGALIGLSLMTAIEILRPIIKYCFKGCKKRTDRIANRQGSGQQLTNRRLVQPNNRA